MSDEMTEQQIRNQAMKGARTAKRTSFKVDSNGVPLDIIAKQKENSKSGDITNDPMFLEMFGSAGTEVKDPISEGGNEDHWISGSAPTTSQQKKSEDIFKKDFKVGKTKEEIPLEQQIIPTSDPNDITNDPAFKEMFNENKKEETKESDSSDSHTIK